MDGLEQVQVRFFTKQKQYAVTDAPTLVPVSLKRYGLSEIVNHLLGTSDAPTPFEFFIQGNVLRTSLGDYLKQAGLSTEHVLELEYAATVRPPTQLGSIPHDDWIGAVDMQQGAIVSGCYDGVVRVFNHSAELQRTLSDHEGPVTTVVMTPASRLFSGSHDQTIIEWDVSMCW
jgi:ribosome biogenesis protein YTM1